MDILSHIARAFDTKGYPDDKDPKNWKTINGAHVHLDKNGNYDGGAGGKFHGKHHWGPGYKQKNQSATSIASILNGLAGQKAKMAPPAPPKPVGPTTTDLRSAWQRVQKYHVAMRQARTAATRATHAQNMLDAIQAYEDIRAKADQATQKSHRVNIGKAKNIANSILNPPKAPQPKQAPQATPAKLDAKGFAKKVQELQVALSQGADATRLQPIMDQLDANTYTGFSLQEKKDVWRAAGGKSDYINAVNRANAILGRGQVTATPAPGTTLNNLANAASAGNGTKQSPFALFDAAKQASMKVAPTAKDADKTLRGTLESVWAKATPEERNAAFEYSFSYKQFQEPLRGGSYGYGGGTGLSLRRIDWNNLGVGTMGKKPGEVKGYIKNLTSIIDKSSYNQDIRLERGTGLDGIAAMFGCSISQLQRSSVSTLTNMLVGSTGKDEGFTSCGSSDGGGFTNKDAVMHIDCPAGTKMLYIEPFGGWGGDAPYDAQKLYNQGKKCWQYWDGKAPQKKFGPQDETLIQRGTTYKCTKVERVNGKLHVYMQVISQDPFPIK